MYKLQCHILILLFHCRNRSSDAVVQASLSLREGDHRGRNCFVTGRNPFFSHRLQLLATYRTTVSILRLHARMFVNVNLIDSKIT